jgi:septal ring factor EnvC (AmiA/AmiB activator)
MDENYFVKITGTNVVQKKMEEVNNLMRRFRRVKMELETIRKGKTAKRKELLNQLSEILKEMEKLQEFMPTKVKKQPEKKDKEKKIKKVIETVEEPMALERPKKKPKTKKVDLGRLKGELEKLKKELEN